MSNNFTTDNRNEQLVTLRKIKEEGYEVIVERITTYFMYVFTKKEDEYKYLVYSYDIETECVYTQDEKVGSCTDFLFYFCNRFIDRFN